MSLIHMWTIEAFGRRWKRVWQEDNATRDDPTAEHLRQAWKRLFGEEYPGNEDVPTKCSTFYYLFEDRVHVATHDGDSIYVPVACAACWDGGWLCGECGKPECECAKSYYYAPPYPCECPIGKANEAEALAARVCPKCQRTSGDDWSQCGGACPMVESPHYQPSGAHGATSPRCSCDAFGEGPCLVHPCVRPERPCPACAPGTAEKKCTRSTKL